MVTNHVSIDNQANKFIPLYIHVTARCRVELKLATFLDQVLIELKLATYLGKYCLNRSVYKANQHLFLN